jgi:hypothetical protein
LHRQLVVDVVPGDAGEEIEFFVPGQCPEA